MNNLHFADYFALVTAAVGISAGGAAAYLTWIFSRKKTSDAFTQAQREFKRFDADVKARMEKARR